MPPTSGNGPASSGELSAPLWPPRICTESSSSDDGPLPLSSPLLSSFCGSSSGGVTLPVPFVVLGHTKQQHTCRPSNQRQKQTAIWTVGPTAVSEMII